MLTALLIALAAPQPQTGPEPVRREQGRVVTGVPQTGVPQRGVPQVGVVPPARPQLNPDGSPPRRVRGWRPPITIIAGQTDLYIPFPRQFGLPDPAPGLYWQRLRNDALLVDGVAGTIIEVRSRWFG